jgi:hypothetical protein
MRVALAIAGERRGNVGRAYLLSSSLRLQPEKRKKSCLTSSSRVYGFFGTSFGGQYRGFTRMNG